MKLSSLIRFMSFGLSEIILRREKAILGTIIVGDKCNLTCKHCAVNNIESIMYPYTQIKQEMKTLYEMGIRILFFCGGETFLWRDGHKSLRDLVKEAKEMGFLIVNIVTNGTFAIDLPEADLILLSLDGAKQSHNHIRGETYDAILQNIREASADNICLYMAINRINMHDIAHVCEVARDYDNIRAVSFNFHTPYEGTEDLSLSVSQKEACTQVIRDMKKRGYPIFNLTSAFNHLVHNTFKTPCRQCVVIENGVLSVCGRCVHIPGLCQSCGYFFAAEYSLVFGGNIRVICDMLFTYLRYI